MSSDERVAARVQHACRPSTKGALRGCVALMRLGSSGRACLDGAAATQVSYGHRSTAVALTRLQLHVVGMCSTCTCLLLLLH